MGLTWIVGVLVIEVDELFALAFVFTIFVAFQGLFIFVIFVLFTKQVRESYAKWWKTKVTKSEFLSKHFGENSKIDTLRTTMVSKLCYSISNRRVVLTNFGLSQLHLSYASPLSNYGMYVCSLLSELKPSDTWLEP